VREVSLHRVHHHIGHSGSRLIGRQGECALGIHDGKARTCQFVGVSALDIPVFFGDDRGFAHLASRRGDGENRGHRQAGRGLRLGVVEVPHVAIVYGTEGYGLGRVDHAASSHGKDKVDLCVAHQSDALSDEPEARVGNHSAEGCKVDIGRPQGVQDRV